MAPIMTTTDYNKFWSPAFDDMGDFVFLLDEDFNFVKVNKSFLKFIDKNEKELAGKKCYSLIHNSTKPPPECPHQKALKTKVFESAEFFDENLKKWLSVNATPIFDDKLNCIGSIHIASDITSRKQAEEMLWERTKELGCLYSISVLIEKEDSLEKILQGVADLLPSGWHYPEVACARITMGEQKFETANFRKTKWKQSADIVTLGKPVGVVELCYLEKMPENDEGPFLKEEKSLLITIAGRLGKVIELVRAEEALRESEARLRLVLEHIDEALFIDDASGKLVYANDRFFEMYGVKHKELGTITLEDYIAPEYRRPLRERHDRRFQGFPEEEHFEYKGQRADGSWFWVEASVTAITDQQGRIIHTQTIARDITKRKHAEVALRESEARYNALLMGAPEGIIAAEMKTRQFRYVNPAICRMFGYPEEEFMRLGVTDLHPKESLDHVISEFKAQARGEKLISPELPCLRKDGTLFYANVSAIKLVLDSRECMVGFFADVTEFKRAQDEVAVAREYADNIIKSMIDALVIVDSDAKIKTLNPATLKMLGYREKELIGKPVGVILEEEEAFKGTRFKKLLKRGFITNSEMTWKTRSGGQIPVNFSGSAMRDRDGRLLGIVGVAHDMRERKKAEDAIRKSQKQYIDLVDSLNDWVWEIDTKGRYTYVSPRVKDFLGYAPEKIVGKTPFDLMPTKEARRVAEIFKRLSAEQRPIVALENINRHKDGHQVFLETSGRPFYDDKGNFMGYRGIDRDITERKKVAGLVKFYKEYAENIVLNLPLSMLVINRNLRVNFANQHFLSRMRLTREDITEQELDKVLGKPLINNLALDKKIMQVIKGIEPRVEGRFVFKAKTYDFMIVPLKEQTGRRRNALLVMEDVTKSVLMEEQLLHSEKLSAVGKFTASVAHEINNPLSIVVGNIQYLLSKVHQLNIPDKKESEELAEMLQTANTEARRCAGIITNLLHFSHRGESEKTAISINNVVRQTVKLLVHQLELSKVQIVVRLAEDLPSVCGNAGRLQQVFVNLMLNAQQVMHEGGKIHITTALDNNYVIVSFRDTGPGIPQKYIRKIFEPFYSTKEAGKGTGLGLFIVHSIMEEHKGKIEIQSKRGQGATFILKLPVVK